MIKVFSFCQAGRLARTCFSFILLAAGCALLVSCAGEDADTAGSSEGSRGIAVAAYEVKHQDLTRVISRTGTVEPLRVIRIAPQMTGSLNEVLVSEGDYVTAGDVLARLDTREHQAELRRAEAQLTRAEAAHRRQRELMSRGNVSQAEYEQAKADFEVAEAEVELWQTRVSFGELKASADAVVTQRYVEKGDSVAANEVLFELADTSMLLVRVGISDRDIAGVRAGTRVPLQMDALPGYDIEAVVRRIFPSADPASRLIPVEFEVRQPDNAPPVRPGYLARVRLEVDDRDAVLAVPSEALLASEGDETWLYVIEESSLKRRDVAVGVTRRNWTEIVDGLSPGELIVGTNPANLNASLQVRITQWIDGEPSKAKLAKRDSGELL